jgi:hypothetical protein
MKKITILTPCFNEEGNVKKYQRQPEMPFAQRFVVHASGPLGQPEVNACERRE